MNATPTFPNSKREQAVVLEYPSFYQDAVRIKYPATMAIESVPATDYGKAQDGRDVWEFRQTRARGALLSFGTLMVGEDVFPVSEYRGAAVVLWESWRRKDQEPVVMIHASAANAGAVVPAGQESDELLKAADFEGGGWCRGR